MRMSKKSSLLIVIILAIGLLAVGCGAANAPMVADREMEMSAGQAAPAEMPAAEESYSTTVSNSVPEQDVERIVIRTGNMSVVVNDPSVSLETIKQLAEEFGGYVVSANLSQTTLDNGVKVPYANVTIRVPAEKLDQTIERVRAESDQLPLREDIASQDVTDQYTDLQSRLRNLQAAEEQLQQIMDSTTKTEEVLSVYNELVRVREQIEVIQGQINYYEKSAAMSSLSVELLADEAVQPLTIGGWQPGGVAKDAIQALISFFKGFANFLIWLVLVVLPALLLIFVFLVLPVWLVVAAIRRRRRKNQKVQDSEVTPPANPEA
jgi:flagellar basal body-associated protein FliL